MVAEAAGRTLKVFVYSSKLWEENYDATTVGAGRDDCGLHRCGLRLVV
jgi:hypothetical protein